MVSDTDWVVNTRVLICYTAATCEGATGFDKAIESKVLPVAVKYHLEGQQETEVNQEPHLRRRETR